jgi:hypothetical protein
MDTITESFTSVNDVYTKALSAVQAQVVAFHRDAAAALAKVGELPSWLPTIEPLVSVDDLVGRAYDFQVQQLESSKQFALDLIDAWTPKSGPARSAKSGK